MTECSVCLVEHDPELHEITRRVRATLVPKGYTAPASKAGARDRNDGGINDIPITVPCEDCSQPFESLNRGQVRCTTCQSKHDRDARKLSAKRELKKRQQQPHGARSRRKPPGA